MTTPQPRKIVVALGGNAIASADHAGDIDSQFAACVASASHIADLTDQGHHVLLIHGNGPQVGATLRRVELARHEVYPIPLALCVANTQAGMGFMICECLRNEMLARRGDAARDFHAATIITTVRVDPLDPAFASPNKPIGQTYDEATARERRETDGWDLAETSPGAWRRVVASPQPQAIEEIELIRHLFDEGRLIVCCGGGGVPVVQTESGRSHSVEAVIDKDLTASLLALESDADTLLILTDIDRVLLDRNTPNERPLESLSTADARRHLESGQFGEGSMAPKIRACIRFIEQSTAENPSAIITRTDLALDALAGRAGTRITR